MPLATPLLLDALRTPWQFKAVELSSEGGQQDAVPQTALCGGSGSATPTKLSQSPWSCPLLLTAEPLGVRPPASSTWEEEADLALSNRTENGCAGVGADRFSRPFPQLFSGQMLRAKPAASEEAGFLAPSVLEIIAVTRAMLL